MWWLFAANAAIGIFSAITFSQRLASVLDRSLHSEQLYNSMNLLALAELLAKPQVSINSQFTASMLLSVAFFLLVLFADGGILDSFYTDRCLDTGEFMAAAGHHFWRFVRLTVILLAPLVAIALVADGVHRASNWLSNHAHSATGPFWFEIVGIGALMFVGLAVRTWFDMAQVHAVAHDEASATRSLRATWITFRGVYPKVVAIHLLVAASMILVALIFIELIPPTGNGLRLLVGEIAIAFWLGCRLWQRASEVVWYQRTSGQQEIIWPETTELAAPGSSIK